MGQLHGRAEEIIVIRYRLTCVNADPDPQPFGRFGVVARKAPLDVRCGAYRVGDLIEPRRRCALPRVRGARPVRV